MKKPNFTALHSVYTILMILYLCCWFVALAGLAASQNYCADDEAAFVVLTSAGGMFATVVGKDCQKLFRFPWTVLWLGFIPLLMEGLVVLFRERYPKVTIGAGSVLWAVIAVLDVLMANLFYNAVQANQGLSALTTFDSDAEHALKCTLAGFAMTAAVALLPICLAPYCAEDADAGTGSTTTAQSAKDTKGGVVPPGQPGAGTPPNVVVV